MQVGLFARNKELAAPSQLQMEYQVEYTLIGRVLLC
jgi:hypothetical protein